MMCDLHMMLLRNDARRGASEGKHHIIFGIAEDIIRANARHHSDAVGTSLKPLLSFTSFIGHAILISADINEK